MGVFTPAIANARVEPINASTPSTALAAKACTLTYDRTWAPYIQGTLTLPLQSVADALATDPRSSSALAVKFTLTQSGGQSLGLNAWLRGRSSDMVGSETTLSFASIESLMQDWADPNGQTYSAATDDVTVITAAMTKMQWTTTNYPIAGLATVDGTAAKAIAAADAGWSSGTSGWDAAQSTADGVGVWVHGDEAGVALIRSAPTYSADTSVHSLSDVDRIISVVDAVNRDDPNWANMVAITFPNSATANAFDASTPPAAPRKVFTMTSPRKNATSGAAALRAARMVSRGRVLTVTAIADLTCRPNQTWQVTYLGYTWNTRVQAVTFRYPDGLMDLTLNVVES